MPDNSRRSTPPRRTPPRGAASPRSASSRGATSGTPATRAAAGTRGATTRRSTGRGTTSARGGGGNRRFFDYPRSRYTGARRWLPSWRVVVGGLLGLAFLGFGAVVGLYVSLKVPAPSAEVKYQTSTVYFADNADGSRGQTMGAFADQKREIVDPKTLPDALSKAVVSMEDRTFYDNSGVDLRGTARALWNNVTGGKQQGGSTLTQQYVERYLVGKTTKDYVGKLREAMLAVKISRTESKDEILGRYLNTIYLGRDCYGVQAAAQAYFGVDAKDLTTEQAALLAGLIPAPNTWDPANNPEKAEGRWNLVLDAMVKEGYLDATARAAMQFPATIAYTPSDTMAGTNGYLLQMVLDELQADLGLSQDDVKRGGYTIVTTIDPAVQAEAKRAADDLYGGALAGETPNPRLRLGITTINPADGSIVALYGGPDYLADARNTVTYEKIQAGSTFKPFTLIAALQKGITLRSVYNGNSPQQPAGWTTPVKNFGGTSYGNIDMVQATANSVNTVYAQVNSEVTPEASAQVAAQAGVTLPQPNVASNVLGVGDVHVLDMASAYATLAAQGVYAKPFIVRQVLNFDGSVAWTGGSEPKRVFDAGVMADTTYAMQQVVQQGSARTAVKPLGIQIAGKTGTSTDNKSAWFIGFTPKVVTAVALFQNGEDGKSIESITPFGNGDQVTGGAWPARLWADYMKPVLAMPAWGDAPAFPDPVYVGTNPTEAATPTQAPTEEPPPTQEPPPTAPAEVTVPSGLEGRTEADAQAALFQLDLQPQTRTEPSAGVAKGRVIRVEPGAGTVVPAGSTVTLVVSSGAPVQTNPPPQPTDTATTTAPTPTDTATTAAGGDGQPAAP